MHKLHIWYETDMKIIYMVQITYGTKWIKPMVRNGICMVRNCKIWYEMHMVQNGYGTKRLDTFSLSYNWSNWAKLMFGMI